MLFFIDPSQLDQQVSRKVGMQAPHSVDDFTLNIRVGPEKLTGHQDGQDEKRDDGQNGIEGNSRCLIGITVNLIIR